MQNQKVLLTLIIVILVTSVLLTIPIQPVLALSPNPQEGDDGFAVKVGDTLTYKITVDLYEPEYVGCKYRFTITNINNSKDNGDLVSTFGWIADIVWCIFSFYNASLDYWETYGVGSIAGYNSSHYFNEFGHQYYCVAVADMLFPMNFTATNHTIVDMPYINFLMDLGSGYEFHHIDPSTIAGTWDMWVGNASTIGSERIKMTLTSKGILKSYQYYAATGTSWMLTYENKLEEKDLIPIEMLFLAAIMSSAGGGFLGFSTETWMIIGVISAIIGVIVIIVAIKKAKK